MWKPSTSIPTSPHRTITTHNIQLFVSFGFFPFLSRFVCCCLCFSSHQISVVLFIWNDEDKSLRFVFKLSSNENKLYGKTEQHRFPLPTIYSTTRKQYYTLKCNHRKCFTKRTIYMDISTRFQLYRCVYILRLRKKRAEWEIEWEMLGPSQRFVYVPFIKVAYNRSLHEWKL